MSGFPSAFLRLLLSVLGFFGLGLAQILHLPIRVSPFPTSSAPAPLLTGPSTGILGGPDPAEGAVVVVALNAQHNLRLEALAPRTLKPLWSQPYSGSGMDLTSTSLDVSPVANNVIDLMPVPKAFPAVDIVGRNATTGALAWNGPRGVVVTDDPTSCGDFNTFCITFYGPTGRSVLAELDPATGSVERILTGPIQNVSSNLYLTDDKVPTFDEIAPDGTLQWTKKVTALYGKGVDTQNGFAIDTFGTLNVGTVEDGNAGPSEGYDTIRTVGIDQGTGAVAWSIKGENDCGGNLSILDPYLMCVFSGSIHATQKQKDNGSLKGLRMNLEGYDPTTGRVTWSVPVSNINQIENGYAEILDNNRMLVTLTNGHRAVLDATTGRLSAVGPNQLFWCSNAGTVNVNLGQGTTTQGSTYGDYSCNQNGTPESSLPATRPNNIGTIVDGSFIWPTLTGLDHRIIGSAQGTA